MGRDLPYVAPPEGPVFRVSRGFEVFSPPPWSLVEEDGTFGNRFDDPGAYRGIKEDQRFRVVYCATQRAGAFGETIARFRKSTRLLQALEQIGDDTAEPELIGGALPQGWRSARRLGLTHLDEDLSFVNFGAPETFQILTEELSPWLVRYGLTEFDLSVITSSRYRRLTQEVARYVYELSDSGLTFAGIRYLSRQNPNWELWAIFHDRMLHTPEDSSESIRADDPGLIEAASVFHINIT